MKRRRDRGNKFVAPGDNISNMASIQRKEMTHPIWGVADGAVIKQSDSCPKGREFKSWTLRAVIPLILQRLTKLLRCANASRNTGEGKLTREVINH